MTDLGDPPASSLRDALAARIRRHGPIPFGDYVEAALYDPTHGFFTRGGGAGRRRDFLTSPEVGPLFGAVLARALDAWWDALDQPDPFTFVDCGAGQGTLARAVARATPRCRDALEVVLVERSAALRADHPRGSRWHSRADLPEPPVVGVIFANELLDNLPFGLRQREGDEWRDVLVDIDDNGDFCDVPRADEGRAADHHDAVAWLRDAVTRVARGRVVVIDYVTTTEEMCRRPWREWVRTYRGHVRGGDPLSEPGLHDITVEVALDQLEAVRSPSRVEAQADFLRRHGIDALVDEGRRVWRERAHLGDLAAIEGRSRSGERDALCDPAGLGGFRVIEWTV
jgi:SAM-dependent MidA family methyltransferase